MMVFQVSLNFDPAKKNTENMMPDLYFNGKAKEGTTSENEDFCLAILQPFQFEPEQKKTCGNESHEKETTEAVVRRCSSK